MDEKKPAIDGVPVAAPVVDDAEAKVAALEAEKAKLIEERENYKVAFLKEKNKGKEDDVPQAGSDEIRRIAREELINSDLARIAREQDDIIRKALKENKELKLAHSKTDPPAAIGSHSESTPVRDTAITPDQMAALKAKGWSEKDFERYKRNLQRYGGR